jgi:DNA-binding NarL/FixJ family response regulator
VRRISVEERPIRVAIHVADRPLRERMIRALAEAGDFVSAGRGDADITIADRPPDVAGPVIALAPTGSQAMARAAAWRCDVRAVLPADVDPMTLGAVITVVAAGLSVAPPDPGAGNLAGHRAGSWAEALDPSGVEDEEPAASLTPREREVLTLLAAGASNKTIARTLGLSVHTVKFHVASLIDKLGARGRVEAAAIAIRTGLIMV